MKSILTNFQLERLRGLNRLLYFCCISMGIIYIKDDILMKLKVGKPVVDSLRCINSADSTTVM